MSPARTVFTAIALTALLACEAPLEPEVTANASLPESALERPLNEVKKCKIVFVNGAGRTVKGPEILLPSAVAAVLEMLGLVTECIVEPAGGG